MNKNYLCRISFKYLLILYLPLLLFTTQIFSQQRLFTNQQHFNVEDGLPQSYITGIIQDEDGFIWLSTFDGFSRYDGRGFRTFRYNPKDSNSLAANTLNGLGKLVNNIVTIYYSPVQADEFNLRTFKITRNTTRNRLATLPNIRWQNYRFSYNSNNWFFSLNNNKGMGWLNALTGKINYATKANGKLQNDTISAITQSLEGKIYIINENGVSVSDTSQTKFEWFAFPTQVKQSAVKLDWDVFGEKFSILALPGNRVATYENNIITLLDINKKTSKQISIPQAKPDAIAGLNGLQLDAKGRAYFEYFGCIYRLTDDGYLKLLWENTAAPARISSFFIDRTDVLWLSLNAQGLLKIDLQALNFESYQYSKSFIPDMMKLVNNHLGNLPQDWNDGQASYYFRQARDSKGTLYACNSWYNKAGVYQFTSAGFLPFNHQLSGKVFSAIICMPNDEIWAFDQSEAVWYCWADKDAVPKKLQLNPADFADVEIADARYVGGYIWMTTYTHGLFQFEGHKLIKKYTDKPGKNMIPKTLTEICVDHFNKNKFWIGSRGGGLILWDATNGMQRTYTIEEGLPNNTIYCILTDKYGNVWCSTNKGIFRLNPTTDNIIAFEKTDGLSDNEFNRAHKLKLADGRLVFGGLNGYTIINPSNFDKPQKKGAVPILITGLQINNKPQDINITKSLIKQSLSTLSVLKLPYYKNYLRFEFAALVFNQPQKIKYRYQLQGADENWIENGNGNVVSYTALPPGKYTFRINATDANGLWSESVKEIKIIIQPAFWATWWAYLFYLLIALALVRWHFLFKERRLHEKQNLAFEKREAIRLREVDELKDRFFSNVTHEFRTPLTLIITPLEKLAEDKSLSAAAIKSVKTAQRNSNQLLRLINEFLDFSKLNDGQLILKAAAGELNIFTADCVQSFEEAALEKNINLSFTSNEVKGTYLFDEEKWTKIITNLVSNALKFTPEQGRVEVALSLTADDAIQLEVKDNGPGIPASLQEKIFTRFYQVDDSAIRNYGGTGIGLSLVKELTELMGGIIKLFSEPGATTNFIITVPFIKVESRDEMQQPTPIIATNPTDFTNNAEAPLLLIVEDNDELRAFLVESMRKHYRVIEAAGGLKAWGLILQELPDLVISDVMMPGQDGFELCKSCKTDNRTSHIGFILLTSKAAHEARLKGLGTGADDYITKPFNLPELELRAANLFQLQQKQRTWLQVQFNHNTPADVIAEITDPFLLQLYKEIDAKIDDAEMGVDYLCKVMAMSRSTLNRKLKSLLNISTNDLIRQYRLQKAAVLISMGTDIATAGYQTGFSSPSYFSQCFKEKYGFTPSDWVSQQN